MLRKDIQPGVVYAYKRRSFDEPVPVVVVATDALYLDLRSGSHPTGERPFRRRPGVSQAKRGVGLPTFYLPGKGNPPDYDLSTADLDLDKFEQWVDIRQPPGSLRAGVVDPRTIVETWAEHVARQEERAQAVAARRAVEDEIRGRQQEVEAETITALRRLTGVRLSPVGESVRYADRVRPLGDLGLSYQFSQDSMDRVVQVLERAQALLAGRGEELVHVPQEGDVLVGPEPPVGTQLSDRDEDVWERHEDDWAMNDGPATIPWSSRHTTSVVSFAPFTVVRWGLPEGPAEPGEGATTDAHPGSPE